uniref:Uncharacterized protein n=1 Tax=Oryza nivara TaxID=4536 RepID=A0A0E0HCI7_ORYNI
MRRWMTKAWASAEAANIIKDTKIYVYRDVEARNRFTGAAWTCGTDGPAAWPHGTARWRGPVARHRVQEGSARRHA